MTAVDMTYEKELAPYQDFDLPDTEEWYAMYREVRVQIKRVLLLNGPARSGKSHVAKHIKSMAGDHCVIVSIPETLYAMMGECGLPNCHLPYVEFKALPWGRRALIDASNRIKRDDLAIICRFAMNKAQAKHPNCQLFVVDNVGFQYEVEWFNDRYYPHLLLMRITTPYGPYHSSDYIGDFRAMFIKGAPWPGDSRSPVTSPGPIITVDYSEDLICWLNTQEANSAGVDTWSRAKQWIRICASYPGSNPELPLGLVDLDSGAVSSNKD